jgi:HPt (histidine-containing phosphotransfer) domain-containing protein
MADEAPRRVLVEDNEVNQALAIAILTKLGYHAALADNGQQAVEQVTRGRYGLVLMDCQLPVLAKPVLLGESRLTELGRLDATGNAALVSRLVECFLDRIPIDLADLHDALDQEDVAWVTRTVHRLKGAAATVGSSGMVSLCEQLEVLATTGPMASADTLLDRLEQEFDRVILALDAIVLRRRSQQPGGE